MYTSIVCRLPTARTRKKLHSRRTIESKSSPDCRRRLPLISRSESGDLIHIEVFDVPELSRDVRISVSGEIGFPPIRERVRAAGLSPFQLEDKLQELLRQSGMVSHPEVSVFVKEQISQPLTIFGAVAAR